MHGETDKTIYGYYESESPIATEFRRLYHNVRTPVDGIAPKLAVIMIGTNNSNGEDNTAEEIGDGIVAICKKLRKELPEMKILILAVFPRAEKPCAQREKNAKASELASNIADGKMIRCINPSTWNMKTDL